MSKLLIVEDEYIERIELRQQLEERFLPQNIRTASSCEDAIDAVKKEPPDLVLLDIMLRGRSGFEVAEFIRHEYPNIKIIILTAYNEFDFAHTAMNMGISDYLLKPVKPLLLLEKIQQVLSRGQQRAARGKRIVWPYLENGSTESLRYVLDVYPNVIGITSFPFQGGRERREEISRTLESFIGGNGWIEEKGAYAILYLRLEAGTDGGDYFNRIVTKWKSLSCHTGRFGVSSKFEEFGRMAEAYQEAMLAYRSRVYYPQNDVISAAECKARVTQPMPYPFQMETDLLRAIDTCDRRRSEECASRLADYFLQRSGFDIRILEKWVMSLFFRIIRHCEQQRISMVVDIDRLDVDSKSELYQRIDAMTQAAISLIQKGNRVKNPLVVKTQEIIRTRFAEDLTLGMVAKELYVNHVYLSRIFKQQVGQSFRDYLIRVRMEEAAKLLNGGNVSIAQVAAKVGYSDANYFSESFSRYHGLPPTEYRNRHAMLK